MFCMDTNNSHKFLYWIHSQQHRIQLNSFEHKYSNFLKTSYSNIIGNYNCLHSGIWGMDIHKLNMNNFGILSNNQLSSLKYRSFLMKFDNSLMYIQEGNYYLGVGRDMYKKDIYRLMNKFNKILYYSASIGQATKKYQMNEFKKLWISSPFLKSNFL